MRSRAIRRPAALIITLFSLLISATPIYAQQPIYSLQGRALLPNGTPPAQPVKISLTFNGMRVYETFTDAGGSFVFRALHGGVYEMIATGDGELFETTRVSVEILATGSAQTYTQDIPLRLKAGKSLSPGGASTVDASDVNVPPRAREAYEKGLKKASSDDSEKALKLFQEAISLHPAFYSAQVAMADQLTKLKRDDEAAAAYQKAIELKPDRAAAYVGLGVMRVKEQHYADALAPLQRSLEIDKQSATPFLFLGLAEMMTGDLNNAETHLLHAYDLGKPMLAHLYLANLYEQKGDPQRAIDQLQAMLKENPNLPEPRVDAIHDAIDKLKRKLHGKK